jgi:uncharacterized protein (DUF2062 family)
VTKKPRLKRRLKRGVFARHCNPWSAWTRWASTPLVLVPIWRRSWTEAAVIGAWLAVNPVVFGEPAHHRAWATRAMLGEEAWVAARRRQLGPAVVATSVEMVMLLVYWQQMARYYDRRASRS